MRKFIVVAGPVYSGKTTFIEDQLLKEYPDAIVCDFQTLARKYKMKKIPYYQIFQEENKSRFLMNKFCGLIEQQLFLEETNCPLVFEMPIWKATQPFIDDFVMIAKDAGIQLKWIQLTVNEDKQQEIKALAEADKDHCSSYFGAEDYLSAVIEILDSNKGRLKKIYSDNLSTNSAYSSKELDI